MGRESRAERGGAGRGQGERGQKGVAGLQRLECPFM